jgi:predicted cobalt transporter CbtA
MRKIAPYWKALVGFIAPGATLVIAGSRDWLVIVATCVVTAAAVYAAPRNKPRA